MDSQKCFYIITYLWYYPKLIPKKKITILYYHGEKQVFLFFSLNRYHNILIFSSTVKNGNFFIASQVGELPVENYDIKIFLGIHGVLSKIEVSKLFFVPWRPFFELLSSNCDGSKAS